VKCDGERKNRCCHFIFPRHSALQFAPFSLKSGRLCGKYHPQRMKRDGQLLPASFYSLVVAFYALDTPFYGLGTAFYPRGGAFYAGVAAFYALDTPFYPLAAAFYPVRGVLDFSAHAFREDADDLRCND
jgi:hypothetical protein